MEGYGENVVLIAIGRGPPLCLAPPPSRCCRSRYAARLQKSDALKYRPNCYKPFFGMISLQSSGSLSLAEEERRLQSNKIGIDPTFFRRELLNDPPNL